MSAATISGSNTVVNVTAGSVPTLNVLGSSLTSGVTVGSGATAGNTSLGVSGGLANLNNTNAIPVATLSGGTTNLAGPVVTLANISGAAVVNVNKGSVASLFASGSATTTVSSSATVGSAAVYGGQVNFNNASGLSNLVVVGGTVSLPASLTVGAANFGIPGAMATLSQLHVSSQFSFNGGAAATISNGNTFTYATSGSNLANTTTAANTLTLSAGVLTLTPTLGAGPAINVFVAGSAQGLSSTGIGPSSDSGTTWNTPAVNATTSNLITSSGATSTVSYTSAGNGGTFNDGGASSTLLSAYGYVTGTQTFRFGGLTPGVEYNLYAINNSNSPGRATTFTTGGSSQTVTTQNNWATATFATAPTLYCEFAGLLANASGQITVAATGAAEVDVNGFQLVPINQPTGSVNLPNTSIVTTGTATLDLGGYGPANALGGLSLGGNVTVQDVVSGGSLQLGGDVVASANAAVALASGAGSVPFLVLSGNTSGVQNVNAASGGTLTLPALAISSGTVSVGNTSGYRGSVVLSGATVLAASGAAVTVNAGTLKVGGSLSGAVSAGLKVNSGATLAGGPAGSITNPVTIQTGATFVPDASAASTALFTGGLTISPSAAFQWSYNGGSAEGTLALGGAALNLPGSGSLVFRPQFAIAPALPVYVMTWNTPPANQPAWSFDGSLVAAGNLAVWNDSNGTWDTGANWGYPGYTSATLAYQSGGLAVNGPGRNECCGNGRAGHGSKRPDRSAIDVQRGGHRPGRAGFAGRSGHRRQQLGNRRVDTAKRRADQPHERGRQCGRRTNCQCRRVDHAKRRSGNQRRQRQLGQSFDFGRRGRDQRRLPGPRRRQHRHGYRDCRRAWAWRRHPRCARCRRRSNQHHRRYGWQCADLRYGDDQRHRRRCHAP